jgi:hypothetical protein
MQRKLTAFITAALMVTAITGFAQTTEPTAAQANQKDPADKSQGQDLVNPKPTDTNPMKSPPTVGQNKDTGNNLVGAGNTGQMRMSGRPDFKTIDMKNHGYVLASEVRNPWLKQNFSKCDTDGDGKVTQEEYGICSKQ